LTRHVLRLLRELILAAAVPAASPVAATSRTRRR
jgi:hypothetical protein